MDNNLKGINRCEAIYGEPRSSNWQTTDWTLVSVLLLTSLEFLRDYQAECEWTRLAAERLWGSEREVSMTMRDGCMCNGEIQLTVELERN
jgi:hypothetical protein